MLSSVCTIVSQPGGVACGSGAELPDADRRDSDGESFPGHGSQPWGVGLLTCTRTALTHVCIAAVHDAVDGRQKFLKE